MSDGASQLADNSLCYRLAATQTMTPTAATNEILAKQRLARPVAPHLAIYKAQITWYLSGLNRLTGVMLSGSFYLFGMAYLVAPYIGLHLESAVIAAAFAKWPAILQFLTKFVVSMPFTFHSFNGLRHLTWDTASMMNNQSVNKTGWAVVGLSTAAAMLLAFL